MRRELTRGQQVGEYMIEQKIAEGGMGEVYAARHPVIGKRAAVKVILAAYCEKPNVVRRFVDEARAVNQIGHPNIIDIFSFGELPDRRSYCVMEWLDGESLEQRLERGPMSVAEGLDVLVQVCDALEATHAQSIVHRDLTPGNIFLVPDVDGSGSMIKLLDFGVAKLGRGATAVDGEGLMVGTPQYVSPEQAAATEDVGASSDVYSLGIVAYEIFLKRWPYDGTSAIKMMMCHVKDAPLDPRAVWPDIPPALRDLILNMLRKAPTARPTIPEVRRVLVELSNAAQLLSAAVSMRTSRDRPMLLRSFDDVSGIMRTLMADLSRGVAWIHFTGESPSVGTPIVVRYRAEALAAQVDLGAVVENCLQGRSLVRFDWVPKRILDRFFSMASVVQWREDEPNVEQSSWAEATTPGPAWTGVSPDPLDAISTKADIDAQFQTGDLLRASTIDPTATSVAPPAPARKAGFGLSARIAALAVLITIAAVVTVGSASVRWAEEDRHFYVLDLSLRTAEHMMTVLAHRIDGWETQLKRVAAGRYEGDTFADVIRCTDVCQTLMGSARQSEVEAAVSLAQRRPTLSGEGGRMWITLATDDAVVVGSIPPNEVLDALDVPSGFSALVHDGDRVVRAVGHDLRAHQLVAQPGQERKGAARYEAPNGAQMVGAWARTGGVRVVVAAPDRVTTEAVGLLARRVALVVAAVLAVALLLAFTLAHQITRRLRHLSEQARRIASGDFHARVRVSGGDEVGELAQSFSAMAEDLRDRDGKVLEAQTLMTEAESRAVSRRMVKWLQQRHAVELDSISAVIEDAGHDEDARALRRRIQQLQGLSERARGSLEQVMAMAAISNRRIELATTIASVVDGLRERVENVDLQYEAPNAVFFPRLAVRESEVRELFEKLLDRGYRALDAPAPIHLTLEERKEHLVAQILFPQSERMEQTVRSTLDELGRHVDDNGASAVIGVTARRVRVDLRFSMAIDDGSFHG